MSELFPDSVDQPDFQSETGAPKLTNRAWESQFETFWEHYPRKTGKIKALYTWMRLDPRPELDDLLFALKAFRNSDQWNRGIIPHPTTWLNQRRFEDEDPAHPIQHRGPRGHWADPEYEQDYRDAMPQTAPRYSQTNALATPHRQEPILGPPPHLAELIAMSQRLWKQYRADKTPEGKIRAFVNADMAHLVDLDRQGKWDVPDDLQVDPRITHAIMKQLPRPRDLSPSDPPSQQVKESQEAGALLDHADNMAGKELDW